MGKVYNKQNVYNASLERINKVYDLFTQEEIVVSFSGGKDSIVMLNLILKVAEERNMLPVKIMHIDFEGQFKSTIEVLEHYANDKRIDFYWVCLPLFYRNSLSSKPYWICWNEEEKDMWVRNLPDKKYDPITIDNNIFEYFGYYYGMKPSQFYNVAHKYFSSSTGKLAQFVGIRTDESLNRFRAIANTKNRHEDSLLKTFSTKKGKQEIYNFYPIYDYTTSDIWKCTYDMGFKYNSFYDKAYKFGTKPDSQRICQPFGDEQKAGLNQWKNFEGDTWNKIVQRVGGANFGAIYCKTYATGHNKIFKPDNLNWKEYFLFLMNTLPHKLRIHYQEYFIIVISNWKNKQKIMVFEDINYTESTKKGEPSFKRFCKMILKNDFVGHEFSFGGRKNQYNKVMFRNKEDCLFIEKKFNELITNININDIELKKELGSKWRKKL